MTKPKNQTFYTSFEDIFKSLGENKGRVNYEDIQTMSLELYSTSENKGLIINLSKTNVMSNTDKQRNITMQSSVCNVSTKT